MNAETETEWEDLNAAPNGIGPVCRECQYLIDDHPSDHALDCSYQGELVTLPIDIVRGLLEGDFIAKFKVRGMISE